MKRAHEFSGAQKRKLKLQRVANAVEKTHRISEFFSSTSSQLNVRDNPGVNTQSVSDSEHGSGVPDEQRPTQSTFEHTDPRYVLPCRISDDPADWRELSETQRIDLVSKGPVQLTDYDFPLNQENPPRKFSEKNYYLTLKNNETVRRSWLVYSKSADRVFCFACRLFSSESKSRGGLSSFLGFGNQWSRLSKTLKTHEQSTYHKECMMVWHDKRSGNPVDLQSSKLIQKEQTYWRAVLFRLINIIQFLAERNLAFRGTNEKLGDTRNGNFLGEVELIAKFDPVLSEHVRRTKSHELSDHYLSNRIQNELIDLLAKSIRNKIISKVLASKYYSIILDCTPDISHREQLSIVLRGVEFTEGCGAEMFEHFVEFLEVCDTTGKGLFDSMINFLSKYGIVIEDCRGQGYDSGSNMRGKNHGVQARFLEINKKAVYMPCASHRLNLVIADAARSSVTSISFFGYLQRMYNLFAASTKRWAILKKHVTHLTVKSLPDTRWEAKVEAVKSLRFQTTEILEAIEKLERVSLDSRDGFISTECRALATEIRSWRFLVCLITWYDLLFQINIISKALQSPSICIDDQISHVEAGMSFVSQYRQEGLAVVEVKARELADELEVDRAYPEPRRRKKTCLFRYESADESDHQTGGEAFRREFFYPLMDTISQSLQERFENMNDFKSKYGFLCGASNMKAAITSDMLPSCCAALAKGVGEGDIDCEKLEREIINFVNLMDSKKCITFSAIECVNYIMKHTLVDLYPNIAVALRIVTILPVTVASCERSFSKLKLIKNFLRNSMSQERLAGLSVISIEHELSREIDTENLVQQFATKKARKVKF